MKKYFSILAIAIALVISSCSSNWLSQEPGGSTITEDQYQNMEDVLRGTLLGIYSSMYTYGGDHDVFGKRAIDMYGDFTCGDMALATFSYGWFQTDEMFQSYTRRAYLWSYYYDIIRLCNKAINAVDAQLKKQYTEEEIDKLDPKFIKENSELFFYYGEILAMRGWCYAELQKWFCYTPAQIEGAGSTLDDFISLPIYTEEVTVDDNSNGAPMSSAADVYLQAEEDLSMGILYLEMLEKEGMIRTMKQEINSDVARLILAYSYLNKGDYTKAAKYAEDFINNTSCTLLPNAEVLTTGFADVNSNDWVWGQDVTVESTTSLASFFGQVDIFSYSYAWAGDVKGIDKNLYEDITGNSEGKVGHPWDIRGFWFNNIYTATKKQYQYAPDGKFYSPKVKQANGYKKAPKSTEIDRDWLCDNVYMRTELGYMIAAEAYCRMDQDAEAIHYLTEITSKRIIDGKDSEYSTWAASLSDHATLLEEIRYNWRVEFWGEGFGLQTMRRFGQTVQLGENHKRSNKTIDPNADANLRRITFEVPSGEQYYNPYIRNAQTTELTVQRN